MHLSDLGWIKTVSPQWMSVISQHRPTVINVWQTSYNSWSRVQPGDLIVLKRQGSVEDVIGFGTVFCRMPAFTFTMWERYGSANGADDEGEFAAQVARRRTALSVADPVIGNIIIKDPILFPDRPFKLFQQSEVPAGHHVWGPISAEICERLILQLSAHAYRTQLDEARAPAPTIIGRENSVDLRLNAWQDAVRVAYGSCCAVTKVRARAILHAVAIQPFDLGGHLQVCNGILLDSDLAILFKEKLIAFHLNGALLVSPDLALQDRDLYSRLAGKQLKLPKRAEDQPDLDLVQWRFRHYFTR